MRKHVDRTTYTHALTHSTQMRDTLLKRVLINLLLHPDTSMPRPIQRCRNIYAHIYMYICIYYTCKHIYVKYLNHVYTYVNIYICIYIYTYNIYIYIHIHIYIYICIYIYIHIFEEPGSAELPACAGPAAGCGAVCGQKGQAQRKAAAYPAAPSRGARLATRLSRIDR